MLATDIPLTPQLQAFLDMIAWSELGSEILAASDDGYNVLVGSLPGKLLLFDSYADHPRKLNRALHSTAAGRYQVLVRTYDDAKVPLKLTDFAPRAQDLIAVQLVIERRALGAVEGGDLRRAIKLCKNIWASFPEAGYGQREHTHEEMHAAFTKAGGKVIAVATGAV